jgi:hypothetical protein
MPLRLTTVLSLFFFAATAFAEATAPEAPAVEKPSISTTQIMMVTAEVMAVDHETRAVTLKGPEGNLRTFTVSEDVKRLGEVEAGDILAVEVAQQMTIEVVAVDGAEPGHGMIAAAARAPESEQPGMVATATEISTARVAEINIEQNTFKLDWGEAGVMEYVARDPENLKRAEVGDMVVVTYTEAIAMQLQEVSDK